MKSTKNLCVTKSSQMFLSKQQCGFCKVFNAEMWLTHMIKKRWKYLNTGGHGSALLTNLSKDCDCNDHQLLITKLNVYVIDTNSLDLLASYLKKRK